MTKKKEDELTDAQKSGFPEDWGGSEFDSGKSDLLPHTPFQNTPVVNDVVRGDPRIDGPYLDDLREAQAAESRKIKEAEAKKYVERKRAEQEAQLKATENKSEKEKDLSSKAVGDPALNPAVASKEALDAQKTTSSTSDKKTETKK